MWNWQQPDWPHFTYDSKKLDPHEAEFLRGSGLLRGAFKHLNQDDKNSLTVDFISDEALKTSEIEGEYLRRESVRSSIRQQFGLTTDSRRISAAERGIATVMVETYNTFATPLTHEILFEWHRQIIANSYDVQDVGCYRTHESPMQVLSGRGDLSTIHFEAPPSMQVPNEMEYFVNWFNQTRSLPVLTRAGIAHLYFVSIHPFEDGNGRIGRVIAEKSLAQSLGQPTLPALSTTIEEYRSDYYDALNRANRQNEITDWLIYFAKTVITAQQTSQRRVEFLIQKTRLFDKVRGKINERQEKVLLRMFRAGPDGFAGGLSAKNYRSITKTSKATTTRDLSELVDLGALTKFGKLKSTRYMLTLESG